MAFIGAEFLLPSQQTVFQSTGALPPTPGKCLVCARYATTFIYRLARTDPSFSPSQRIPLQAFGNAMGVVQGEAYPTHASVAHDVDGYRTEALLFADETWAETNAARGTMSALLWRPVVKFVSSHYKYVIDDTTKRPRLLQINMGVAPDSDGSGHFGMPAREKAKPASA